MDDLSTQIASLQKQHALLQQQFKEIEAAEDAAWATLNRWVKRRELASLAKLKCGLALEKLEKELAQQNKKY